ncbi:hypothetical protein [Streptomyces sp. NPDC048462]|uniref:hypothetical protein n=1 Tax=Streptomyces sp. NPDC048462 TaxID=3365555 RepID=UPI00371C13D1
MGMDVAVGMLIMWAVGKARRAGGQLNGLTDHTMELLVQRLWELVDAKLGGDPAIQQLVSESRENGDATAPARTRAENVLRDAADQDPRFAAQLEAILSNAGGGNTSPPADSEPTGIRAGGAVVTGANFGRINANTSIKNVVARNPLPTLIVAVLVLVAAFFGIRAMIPPSGSGEEAPGSSAMVGTWKAAGSADPMVFGQDGTCSGFYYDNGAPLDIGGPMTCSISSTADEDGRYAFVVTQSPNKATYRVGFVNDARAVVYSSTGQKIYEMSRF